MALVVLLYVPLSSVDRGPVISKVQSRSKSIAGPFKVEGGTSSVLGGLRFYSDLERNSKCKVIDSCNIKEVT